MKRRLGQGLVAGPFYDLPPLRFCTAIIHVIQVDTAREGVVSDARHARRDGDALHPATVGKGFVFNNRRVCRQCKVSPYYFRKRVETISQGPRR